MTEVPEHLRKRAEERRTTKTGFDPGPMAWTDISGPGGSRAEVANDWSYTGQLFQWGDFTLASGQQSNVKIACDVLTAGDWETIARLVASQRPFGTVESVPTGGDRFGIELAKLTTEGHPLTLIVDDVWTTGGSMERVRAGRTNVFGIVLFARRPPASWVRAIFQADGWFGL